MKSTETPETSNTRLHNAILARDNVTAKNLINEISAAELNKKSLGNTPLMLALKTANFEVARAILKRDDVEVIAKSFRDRAADDRGISPLHLACAWRENDIITAILDKYHRHIVKELEGDYSIKDLFEPSVSCADALLIQLPLQMSKLPGANQYRKKSIETRTHAKIYGDNYSRETLHRDIKAHEYYVSIVDKPQLIIDSAPELTDALLFHSKLICLNLGLLEEGDFKEHPSSQYQFAHNLAKGLAVILEHRNKKPVDEKIAATLGANNPAPEQAANAKLTK